MRNICWGKHADDSKETHIGRNSEPFSIGKRQKFVVVKNRVQVLHPLRVNVTVKHDPLSFADLTTDVVDDSEQYPCKWWKPIQFYTAISFNRSINAIFIAAYIIKTNYKVH